MLGAPAVKTEKKEKKSGGGGGGGGKASHKLDSADDFPTLGA